MPDGSLINLSVRKIEQVWTKNKLILLMPKDHRAGVLEISAQQKFYEYLNDDLLNAQDLEVGDILLGVPFRCLCDWNFLNKHGKSPACMNIDFEGAEIDKIYVREKKGRE
ncbi:hypothetical protein ACFLY6_02705, partial [Candidatus Dependentiae bacterium]